VALTGAGQELGNEMTFSKAGLSLQEQQAPTLSIQPIQMSHQLTELCCSPEQWCFDIWGNPASWFAQAGRLIRIDRSGDTVQSIQIGQERARQKFARRFRQFASRANRRLIRRLFSSEDE